MRSPLRIHPLPTTSAIIVLAWAASCAACPRKGVAQRQGSAAPQYFLDDHLGSTSLAVDSNGNLTAELRYKAWGETRYTNGSTPTTYKYTGQKQEATLGGAEGLYFYNARWYDPYLNRWIQPDTIIPDPYNPQDYDRYSYVRNNPINNTDPSGHMVPCTNCDSPTYHIDLTGLNHGILGALAVSVVLLVSEIPCTLLAGCHVDLVNAQIIGPTPRESFNNVPVLFGDLIIDPFLPNLGPRFRSFTSDNFRWNLMKFTGKESSDVVGLQAHHMLPQEFIDKFTNIGFNINDPVFGSWVDSPHQSWSYDYNQAWKDFFSTFEKEGLVPTKQQVLDFAADLAKQFNINWTPPTSPN